MTVVFAGLIKHFWSHGVRRTPLHVSGPVFVLKQFMVKVLVDRLRLFCFYFAIIGVFMDSFPMLNDQ